MSSTPETSVLFVCLGNICRSPLAEGVFRHLVDAEGLGHRFSVDSAGTGGWHVGERADPRSIEVAERHGIALTGAARRLESHDLRDFDHVIVMDRQNLRDVESLRDIYGGSAMIRLLLEFDDDASDLDVPDPYYGGPDGFERVYQMVFRSCEALLVALR